MSVNGSKSCETTSPQLIQPMGDLRSTGKTFWYCKSCCSSLAGVPNGDHLIVLPSRVVPGFRKSRRWNLTSTDERHLRRHYRHELNIRIQWQARHIEHGIGDMLHVHPWFRNSGAVRLQRSGCQCLGHFRSCVSNVNLTTRDV